MAGYKATRANDAPKTKDEQIDDALNSAASEGVQKQTGMPAPIADQIVKPGVQDFRKNNGNIVPGTKKGIFPNMMNKIRDKNPMLPDLRKEEDQQKSREKNNLPQKQSGANRNNSSLANKLNGLNPKNALNPFNKNKEKENDKEDDNNSSEDNNTGADTMKKAGQSIQKVIVAVLPQMIIPILIAFAVVGVVASLLTGFQSIFGTFSSFEVSNAALGNVEGSTTFNNHDTDISDEYMAELIKQQEEFGTKADYDLITATLFSEEHLMDYATKGPSIDDDELESDANNENQDDEEENTDHLTDEEKEELEKKKEREKEAIDNISVLAEKQQGDKFLHKTSSSGVTMEPALEYVGEVKDIKAFYLDAWKEYGAAFTQDYGNGHNGIDIGAPEGTPIYSPIPGTVVYAGNSEADYGGSLGTFGNVVVVEDINQNEHVFAHMVDNSIVVSAGDSVIVGTVLGGVGNTGYSEGNHLHYAIYQKSGCLTGGSCPSDKTYDPIDFFNDNPSSSGGIVGTSSVGYAEEIISLEEWRQTAYYDYLILEFIPDYYDEFLPDEVHSSDRQEAILSLGDYIYDMWKQYKSSYLKSASNVGQTCEYTANSGEQLHNVKVELLECWTNDPIDTELVDLEKYITGVVYAEVGGFGIETLKTQSIAARGYLMTRGEGMPDPIGTIREEDGYTVISIRNCTADQAYCDPDLGCWSDSSSGGDTIYPGQQSGKAYSKGPLAEDSLVRQAVSETVGQVLLNSENKLVYTPYTATDGQHAWGDMETSGKGYQQIIIEWYEQKYGHTGYTLSSNCITDVDGIETSIGSYKKPIINYYQGDYETTPYFDSGANNYGSFRDFGCTQTSFAIVASTILGETHSPTDQLDYTCPTYCGSNGTAIEAIDSFKERYPELEVSNTLTGTENIQEIVDAISSGDALVLVATHPRVTAMFKTSHSIVLTGINEEGEITVADPASRDASKKTYTVEEVMSSVNYAWIVK